MFTITFDYARTRAKFPSEEQETFEAATFADAVECMRVQLNEAQARKEPPTYILLDFPQDPISEEAANVG